MNSHTRTVRIATWLLVLSGSVRRSAAASTEEDLCGLSACDAVDLAKAYTELTMNKMLKMIKPEALEKVFQNMEKMENLIKTVEQLSREVKSLFQPGEGDELSSGWR